jgi:hypothetical protein
MVRVVGGRLGSTLAWAGSIVVLALVAAIVSPSTGVKSPQSVP